jgi:hypothetical protein
MTMTKMNLVVGAALVLGGALFVHDRRAASRDAVELRHELAEERRVSEQLVELARVRAVLPSPSAAPADGTLAAVADLGQRVDQLTNAAAKAAPAPAEPTSEQLAAATRATSMFHAKLGTGHWTEENRAELRQLLRSAPRETRHELTLELVDALNAGTVVADLTGPPL